MTDNEIVGEVDTETTLTLTKVEVENIPQPSFVYETQGVLSAKFNAMKQEYILTQSAKLGINPKIVIEQSQFIDKLKAELAEVRAESKKRESALREQIAREIEAQTLPKRSEMGRMGWNNAIERATAIARGEK